MSALKQTNSTGFVRLLVTTLAVLSLAVVDAVPVEAQTRKQLTQARERYRQVQADLNRLVQEHSRQQDRLESIRTRVSTTRREIAQAEEQNAQLQDQLRDRVRSAYRMGGMGFFQFLLSAESFREFSLRVVMLERQSTQDEDLILKLRKTRAELNAKENALKTQQEEQSREVSALRSQANRMNTAFKEAETLVGRLQRELNAQQARRVTAAARSTGGGGGGSGRVIPFQACPVQGPRAFSNDWGAPRGGGRRRHKGNDIFAPQGAPSVAVVSGRISRLRSGGLGGLSVYLWGDDGNEYYYAHMSGFAVSQGERVSAGQVIAYVGNTGNARGGAPHVHFEIHPGGGSAINPYYSLIRVC